MRWVLQAGGGEVGYVGLEGAVAYARGVPHEVQDDGGVGGCGGDKNLEGRELPVGEHVVDGVQDADECQKESREREGFEPFEAELQKHHCDEDCCENEVLYRQRHEVSERNSTLRCPTCDYPV